MSTNEKDWIEIRRAIHRHPEVSGREVRTSATVYDFLKSIGLEPTWIDPARKIGVAADVAGCGNGPTLALRADLDALGMREETGLPFASEVPDAMHSCGHDIHTAALLGAAALLVERRDTWCGRVRLLFQEGEETFTGATKAIRAGLLQDVAGMMALHAWPPLPAGSVGFKRGSMMAAGSNIEIVLHGRGGHAAHPHLAVDPVVMAAHTITALQTAVSRGIAPLEPAVLTFGSLAAGEVANIIPETATLKGTARTLSRETDQRMKELVERIAAAQAESFGGRAEVTYSSICPPLENDPELTESFVRAVVALLGEEAVYEIESPSMGSEDFAMFLAHVPGMLFRLGTHNEQPETRLPLHNPHIQFDERAIGTGARVMAHSAAVWLNDNENKLSNNH